jgi:SAM-dependent methyltransferase
MRRVTSLPASISGLLLDGVELRPVGDGVWSVLPADAPGQVYDRRAAAYDFVVGSRLYNRLLWGSSPQAYGAFADRAVFSGSGPLLDAGCGSLVFTAAVYARTDRPLVLVDRSIGMLRAARTRLHRAVDGRSDGVVLLQADLRRLPFKPRAFSTVLCMGMLHLFDDVSQAVFALAELAEPGGHLFLTSLVAETRIGKGYLSVLHRAGEVATPRTRDTLLHELQSITAAFDAPHSRDGRGEYGVCGRPQGRVTDAFSRRRPAWRKRRG